MIIRTIYKEKKKNEVKRRILAFCMGMILVWGFFKYQEVKRENGELTMMNGLLFETLNDEISKNSEAKQIINDFQNVRSAGDVKKAITAVFGNQAAQALEVSRCENGLRLFARANNNTNGTFDSGFFQINSIHRARFGDGFLNDPAEHLLVARVLWNEQGTTPWNSSRKCWSKQ